MTHQQSHLYMYMVQNRMDISRVPPHYYVSDLCFFLAILCICPSLSMDYGVSERSLKIIPEPLTILNMRTLFEWVERGHRSDTINVSDKIFQGLTSDKTKQLISELFLYPPRIDSSKYTFVRYCPGNVLRAVLDYLHLAPEIQKFLTLEERIFIVTRGYLPNSVKTFEESQRRYEKIIHMSEDLQSILISLYPVSSDPLCSICRLPVHPLENILIERNAVGDQEGTILSLASKIGMLIPVGSDVPLYFDSNVLFYRNVYSGSGNSTVSHSSTHVDISTLRPHQMDQQLRTMSDMDIFSLLGIYINYTSRADLLDSIMSLHTKPMFFLVLTPRDTCNKETTLFTPINELSFMIGYGLLNKYRIYEIEELQLAFGYASRDNFLFRIPERPQQTFHIRAIEQLQSLLKQQQTGSENCMITQLVNTIYRGIIEVQNKSEYDRTLFRMISPLPESQKKLISASLLQLFHCGMYMRRWKGPGHPYPVTLRDTRIEFEPDQLTHEALLEWTKITDALPEHPQRICHEMRMVEYHGYDITRHNPCAKNYVQSIQSGQRCIRVASTIFISTGYYYLWVLFNETIQGVDPQSIVHIS